MHFYLFVYRQNEDIPTWIATFPKARYALERLEKRRDKGEKGFVTIDTVPDKFYY